MDRAADRVRRLNAKRQAQRAIERLRALVRTLAEIEELEDVDAIGVVTIQPGEPSGHYSADLLDIVAQAVSEAGRNRVVEVVVTSRRTPTTGRRARPQEEPCPERDSTRMPAPRSGSPVR